MARKIANYTSENNDYAQEAMARMKNENARLDELLEEQQQVIEELELVSRAVTRDVFFECKNEAMKLRSDINTLENVRMLEEPLENQQHHVGRQI